MNANKVFWLFTFFFQVSIAYANDCKAVKFPIEINEATDKNKLFEYFEKTNKNHLFSYYYYEVLHDKNIKLKESLYQYLLAGNKNSKEKILLEAFSKIGHKLQNEKELCDFVNLASKK